MAECLSKVFVNYGIGATTDFASDATRKENFGHLPVQQEMMTSALAVARRVSTSSRQILWVSELTNEESLLGFLARNECWLICPSENFVSETTQRIGVASLVLY